MSNASVRILGPLDVRVDGRRVEPGGGRQRALLAILALRANEVITSDRLVDDLWGDRPPPTAHKALQNAISELRSVLGPAAGVLVTRSNGYVLELDADALDARRFEQLAAEGRRELEENPRRAAKLLGEALGLWHGQPLVDFAYDDFAQPEILRLEELRLAALEDRIHADLALGRHAELVPELEPLVAAHPHRDRLRVSSWWRSTAAAGRPRPSRRTGKGGVRSRRSSASSRVRGSSSSSKRFSTRTSRWGRLPDCLRRRCRPPAPRGPRRDPRTARGRRRGARRSAARAR